MKTEIKNLRIQIDGLAQLTKELKPLKLTNEEISTISYECGENKTITHLYMRSKEIEKATDSLYLAKAWLGKILELLGSETPYKNDGSRNTVEDIEPAADKHKFSGEVEDVCFQQDWKIMEHIEKVDWLREEIKDIINNTEDFSETIDYIELEQGFVYKHLCEARFWLGFELQRIREEK